MTVPRRTQRLFELLQSHCASGSLVTETEILSTTGWKRSTFRTYWGKGLYTSFLTEIKPGRFEVARVTNMTPEEFQQSTTQSQYVRELGYGMSSRLARALLRRSRDNMILALELYNRPSLENRLDGFVLLFCTAWEQLLKAQIIEDGKADKVIFRRKQKGRPRETISLTECMDRTPLESMERENLARIKLFRDKSAHLLMPEVQPLASRLFQAGVQNFAKRFRSFASVPFVPNSSLGLLTLIVDASPPSPVQLQGVYGARTAAELLELVQDLEAAIQEHDNPGFALPLEYRLVFAKSPADADLVISRELEAARSAVVVEKPRDVDKTHPFLTSELPPLLHDELRKHLLLVDLERHLVSRDATGHPCLNSYDIQACIARNGWKKANNRYHHLITKPKTHRYSQAAVEHLAQQIVRDAGYVREARAKKSSRRPRRPPSKRKR